MSESFPNQPLTPEDELRNRIAELDTYLAQGEILDAAGESDPGLKEALVTMIDGKVENDPVFSGGFTIPGTDEWIPGEKQDRYTFTVTDAKTSEKTSVSIDSTLGQRMEAYVAAHRAEVRASRQTSETEHQAIPLPAAPERPLSKEKISKVDWSDIADLVNVDSLGRGHVSHSHKSADSDPHKQGRNGKIISNQNLALIEAHQDQIRDGLAARNRAAENASTEEPVAEPYVEAETGDALPVPVEDRAAPAPAETPRQETHYRDILSEYPRDDLHEMALALNEYTKLAAARERSTVTAGRTSKEAVEAARQKYETLRQKAKVWEWERLEEYGKAERLLISNLSDRTDAKIVGLAMKVEAERLANPTGPLAGMRKRFYNWWARQGEGEKFFSKKRLAGTAKKAGVMIAIGVPVGLVAGTAGAVLAGPIVGGALAAGVARGVSRGFLRGRIERGANGISVAGKNYEERVNAQQARIDEFYQNGDQLPSQVTSVFAEGVDKNVRRNRARLLGSAILGAVGGTVGAELAHSFLSGHTGNSHGGHTPAKHHVTHAKHHHHAHKSGEAKKPATRLELGHNGDSVWAETVNYANARGITLTNAQAHHVVGEILRSNHQSWESAHHLPVGYHFGINQHELDELLEDSKQ